MTAPAGFASYGSRRSLPVALEALPIDGLGVAFLFVPLAGFHSVNSGMFELASEYKQSRMAAYSKLQQAEFAAEKHGDTATRHHRAEGLDGERAVPRGDGFG